MKSNTSFEKWSKGPVQWNSPRDFPAIYETEILLSVSTTIRCSTLTEPGIRVHESNLYLHKLQLKIHFNIILPSRPTPSSCMQLRALTSTLQNFSLTPYAFDAPSVSSPWFDCLSTMWWIQIKINFPHFYIFPLRFKYSRQHTILHVLPLRGGGGIHTYSR
jgi:hypothetical protein